MKHSRTGMNTRERWLILIVSTFVLINLVALFTWLTEHSPGTRQSNESSISYDIIVLNDTNLLPLSELTTELNSIPIDQIVIIPPTTVYHLKAIFDKGQRLGRNPKAFSKIGDSTIESPHFLDQYDQGNYNLGDYNYLQIVVNHFQGSFNRQSVAVQRGMHSWSIFDPMWVSTSECDPGDGPIECEIRIHNPAFVIIRLGSNDVGNPESFLQNMRKLLDYNLETGVIPIIGTKSDRNEGSENTNNSILRQLSADYQLPLWDFDRIAQTLPNNGMRADGIHLTYFPSGDYTDPNALQSGYGIHNLSALMMLYEILRLISIK